MFDGVTQELKNAGMDASAALSPLGAMRKSVPAARRVTRKGAKAEGGRRKAEGEGVGSEGCISSVEGWGRLKSWKMAQEIPRPSRPGQMEGPLRRKRAPKRPTSLGLFLFNDAKVNIKNTMAKMELAACRDRAIKPGSRAMKKARSKPGRGLRRLSKRRGAKTRRLPMRAGTSRARKFVPPP